MNNRIGFLGHFTWFFWLNIVFLTLNLVLTPGRWWCLPVFLLWSLALLLHFVAVFFIGDLEGPYRDRELRSEMERLQGRE